MDSVVHFEIPFEKEENKEFYKKVFGWDLMDMPEMQYTIVRTGEVDENNMLKALGVINGGMFKKTGDSVSHPVIVIDVKNIEEKIKEIIVAGGELFREIMDVGDMGRYAQVKDLDGNIIGVWETLNKG
jgi:predicted enzyme related to lactoylglutathione lyase